MTKVAAGEWIHTKTRCESCGSEVYVDAWPAEHYAPIIAAGKYRCASCPQHLPMPSAVPPRSRREQAAVLRARPALFEVMETARLTAARKGAFAEGDNA